MNSSGITRGVAATAIAALAVAGLPLLTSPAHAVLTTVQINNLRDRTTFDLDEFRDGDDFRIETRDENGVRVDDTVPEFRWVLDTGGAPIEGTWITAERRAVGSYRVDGPSRTGGGDGITDAEIQAGTWTLEARAGAIDASPLDLAADESEITLDGPVSEPAGGTHLVTGDLATADDGLGGRAVELTYTRQGAGDARFQGGGLTTTVVTEPDGSFSATLVDPSGTAGEDGTLVATASGEEADDETQLAHRYGPNDADNPDADATDKQAVTWEGPDPIVATLQGRSNGARADVLKVVAPTKARGATVRLFRVAAGGRLAALKSTQLNQSGDKQFRVNDRNRKKFTTYVAKVGPTATTARDDTNRRRVR